MEEKLDELIKVTEDNSGKTQELVSELEKERSENKSKDKIIGWLCGILATVLVLVAIVAGIFVYGYMYSPNLAQITQSGGDSSGNQVQMIGG